MHKAIDAENCGHPGAVIENQFPLQVDKEGNFSVTDDCLYDTEFLSYMIT